MSQQSNTLSADDQRNLEALLNALPDNRTQASLPDCNTYKTYRPILESALPLIKKIPLFGAKIYTALSFLMQLADGVCQISLSSQDAVHGATNGALEIQKVNNNELLIKFPQDAKINAGQISETDLYLALGRKVLTPAQSGNALRGCIIEW
ncbi:hypothetical protein [Paraburkholderia bannensis]|uniref:hypothetical protein n=1 Tax=Paraburkholderia bannensis TaxID=765414 RepID=UPI000488EE6D|nr:hypothetical protein [Paraburkholderia bannensis]